MRNGPYVQRGNPVALLDGIFGNTRHRDREKESVSRLFDQETKRTRCEYVEK